ncbi:DUF1993 domain-containing protein [Sphingomonas panacisoli]|uniref:DUF1993 domain-containing protein n=1 Tax=Sphingomonas panacisoli TaxID=1813879 RepID=A0A5B8LDB9_9SPHN|nr:DUF1993 domain-containing protein [Sphingomonas panacisoli]QDZ06087.1 DUF1993 domain-containing protein [Sphingomonas panacisoli]
MPITMFSFVDLYDRTLNSLSHLIDKGVAFATEQGIDPESILDWRLIDDMHPFRFQAEVVISFARQWTARAAGSPVPDRLSDTVTLADLRAGIAAARADLAALTPEQFAGRDDEPMTIQITDAMEPTLPTGQWLSVFATTNIYFHLSMAYAILRMRGVPIGKIDLFAGRL